MLHPSRRRRPPWPMPRLARSADRAPETPTASGNDASPRLTKTREEPNRLQRVLAAAVSPADIRTGRGAGAAVSRSAGT